MRTARSSSTAKPSRLPVRANKSRQPNIALLRVSGFQRFHVLSQPFRSDLRSNEYAWFILRLRLLLVIEVAASAVQVVSATAILLLLHHSLTNMPKSTTTRALHLRDAVGLRAGRKHVRDRLRQSSKLRRRGTASLVCFGRRSTQDWKVERFHIRIQLIRRNLRNHEYVWSRLRLRLLLLRLLLRLFRLCLLQRYCCRTTR